ncbi:hypothetical protein Fmac_026270 [Flemingia macrophylla]|uniref:Uncharacterized protein n=1 Tax=Flemingia macrophylla TaxID=520843 RepID=A0ABD1LEK2_9FABA
MQEILAQNCCFGICEDPEGIAEGHESFNNEMKSLAFVGDTTPLFMRGDENKGGAFGTSILGGKGGGGGGCDGGKVLFSRIIGEICCCDRSRGVGWCCGGFKDAETELRREDTCE